MVTKLLGIRPLAKVGCFHCHDDGFQTLYCTIRPLSKSSCHQSIAPVSTYESWYECQEPVWFGTIDPVALGFDNLLALLGLIPTRFYTLCHGRSNGGPIEFRIHNRTPATLEGCY